MPLKKQKQKSKFNLCITTRQRAGKQNEMTEKEKAEQMLEKHINENDLNFIFHEKKDLWQELLNAMNEALCLALVGRSYSFVEPKFFVDDKVWFKDNKGFEMEGKIVAVETHWSKKNESYHIYSLYKEGRKRLMHVGERNIIYRYDF